MNWFFILGLDFGAPRDAALIEGRIAEKARYWSEQGSVHSRYDLAYESFLSHVADARATLLDAAGYERLAGEAKSIAEPIIDANVMAASYGQAKIDDETLAKVQSLCEREICIRHSMLLVDIPVSAVRRRVRALTCGITAADMKGAARLFPEGFDNLTQEERDAAVAEYDELLSMDLPHERKFYGAKYDLCLLEKGSLYDFAAPDGCANPMALPASELISNAESVTRFYRERPKFQAHATAAERCLPLVREILSDPAKRIEYNNYLIKSRASDYLGVVEGRASLAGGIVDAETGRQALGYLTNVLNSAAWARGVLRGFCSSKGLKLAKFRHLGSSDAESLEAGYAVIEPVHARDVAQPAIVAGGEIQKRIPTIYVNKDSVSIGAGETAVLNITYTGDGEVSAHAADPRVVSCTVGNMMLILTGYSAGEETTVSLAAGETSACAAVSSSPISVRVADAAEGDADADSNDQAEANSLDAVEKFALILLLFFFICITLFALNS